MITLFSIAGILGFLALGLVTINVSKSVSGLASASARFAITDDAGIEANPSVLVAKAGTLTVRTNNTSGSLTMSAGHGIVTGQRVDLYWDGGQCYGAVVGTVATNVVPIASVSGGDNLPAAATAITVGKCKQCPFSVDGDKISGIVLSTPRDGYFVLADGSGDVFAQFVEAGSLYEWTTSSTGSNPLAGLTPTKIFLSHSYVTAAVSQMQAAAIHHS